MQFDYNLSFNFLSIFTTALLVIVTTATVFQRLKWRWPLKVNCWFCNSNTKIWRQQLNWWLCPHCGQYNGFTKDGDYARVIPEQYKTTQNVKKYCNSVPIQETNGMTKRNLCQKCNHYERIKLSKLSEFKPVYERNFEYEVEQFKQNLEEKYPLCAACRNTVQDVLRKQSLWLTQYKMLLFKQKPIRAILNNSRYSGTVFRIISTILDSMVPYNMEVLTLPIGGLFSQLCACWLTPAKRRSSDVLVIFLWICIILLIPFKDLKLIKTDFNNEWLFIDYITQYHVITLFSIIIGFINIKPQSQKTHLNNNLAFKKIESPLKNNRLNDSFDAIPSYRDFSPKMNGNVIAPVVNTRLSMNSMNNSALKENQGLTINSSASPIPLASSEPQICAKPFTDSLFKTATSDNNLLNYAVNTLNSLSLSEESLPKCMSRIPKIFEKKVYNPKGSDLFRKSNGTSSNRKPILSPPKLKSVMQTSWVAGGYWQEGIDAPTLSRSSSQSSGFGSTGSNFAPSREPSVHEFDQCSVMSDVTQSCYTPRPNSASSVGCMSQRQSPYSFIEPKTPMTGQTVRYKHSPSIVSPSFLLQRGSPPYMDQCLQNQHKMNTSDIKNQSDHHIFPSHTTIVTSPVWLPALLCSSLVLNIIVLCTTLMR